MSREFKDSGIEWIGRIPKEWKVLRAKSMFLQRNSKGNSTSVLLSATQKQGMLPQEMIEGVVQVNINTDLQTFKTVHKNDFVISLRSFQGGFEMSNYEGVCSPAYQVFYNRVPIAYRYFWMLFKSYGFIDKINSLTVGIREGKNIQYKDFANMQLAIPPIYEQQKIADYLDKVCGEADEMIALQEKMIEELKAYKQSVITEAVTKGLNPNAPMKDSGIDWIGEIPKHWGKSAIKHIITKIESGVSVNAELIKAENDELGVLKTSSVSSNCFIPSENKRVDFEEYNRVSCPVKADTIIVSRMNTPELVGAAGYCSRDIPTIFLPDRLWQVHFDKSKLYVKFGWYYLISSPIKAYYSSLSSGTSSSMQNISQPQFCKAFFLLPPMCEQQQIVFYLDSKCSEIDSLIALKKQKIEELKEYKKSVIYEYVTGKKDVV